LATLTRDEQIILRLQEKHGLNPDEASRLLVRLRRSLALDIIDDDTGMPVALYDDDEAVRIGEELNDDVAAVSERD
jgi:hypothetical protein